ncbi:MAG TPA: radical SAM peptide maturase, CXXX-repeat target family [Clostridia bacterium]
MDIERNAKVMMGQMPEEWESKAKNITFSVTEDCNLACKYCYMTGKNSKNKLTFETAKKAVDFVLSDRKYFNEPAVVWEFIGGEPFLEIELIDQISDYIKQQMFILEHPWFNAYRFSFSSNGLLYSTPLVQKYIMKNRGHISIGLSVDGNKIKHDLQRVKPDGSGSYDDVVANVPLWMEQFPGSSTKATFSSDDLPYLKDSIISLWNIGIKMVMANVVFEDVWKENDDIIFENQLRELADYILENDLWKDHSVRFFNPTCGFPLDDDIKKQNFCGSGRMMAFDTKGDIYPCIRFYDMSLNNKKAVSVGNIYDGINEDLLRPFMALSLESQSNDECVTCEVANGCAWCTGCNYDVAETDTIFQRAIFICKMHKANMRANEYFWDKFEEVTGLESERKKYWRATNKSNLPQKPLLQFITDDNITPHCNYRNNKGTTAKMDDTVLKKGLDFAARNKYVPVFLGDISYIENEKERYTPIPIYDNSLSKSSKSMFMSNDAVDNHLLESAILLINSSNIENLTHYIKGISRKHKSLDVVLEEVESWDDKSIDRYDSELQLLSEFLYQEYKHNNSLIINISTKLLDLSSMENCGAGESSFALAPNGRFYLCPAFYFDNPDDSIGNLDEGIQIKNQSILNLKKAMLCSDYCDAYHCKRCKFLNKKMTREYNTPSKRQCVVSHIERKHSYCLQKKLVDEINMKFSNRLSLVDYSDPMEILKYNLL